VDQVVGGAAVALFVVFLGALRATLRAKEGEAGALSAIAVIGGSVVAAGLLVDVALEDTSLSRLLALPTAVLLVAASVGALTTRALPSLVAYAGLVAALLQLPAAFGVAERLAVGSLAAWAVLTSAAMLRQRAG
jgi:hypothetical protein